MQKSRGQILQNVAAESEKRRQKHRPWSDLSSKLKEFCVTNNPRLQISGLDNRRISYLSRHLILMDEGTSSLSQARKQLCSST
ncbi:hypothetical protein SUGI_0807750 [Cryptomeria japonica]|nr:hypothetical protein SUGI_0807750 [Cryptomeria japonica]